MAWSKSMQGTYTIDDDTTLSFSTFTVSSNTLYYAEVTFPHRGYVNYYSAGSEDYIGFISTSDEIDTGIGVPVGLLYEDDDSGDGNNFKIEGVTVAEGSTLYFWFKHFNGDVVDPPSAVIEYEKVHYWTDTITDYSRIASRAVFSGNFSGRTPYVYQCYRLTFEDPGYATIQISSDMDYIVYVTDFYTGAYDPETGLISRKDYIRMYTNSGSRSPEFSVETDAPRWIWIRPRVPTDTGIVTVTVYPPDDGGGEITWDVVDYSEKTISNDDSSAVSSSDLDDYVMIRMPVTFSESGKYRIYDDCEDASFIFLATSDRWSQTDGWPENILESGIGDFDVVVSTGTWYYLFVRTQSGEAVSSSFTVYFKRYSDEEGGEGGGTEWVLDSETYGRISALKAEQVRFKAKRLYRRAVSFDLSGSVIFYSASSIRTVGYISTDPAWNEGEDEPANYFAKAPAGSSGYFSTTRFLSAGRTYYFWFRLEDGDSEGNATIYIQPPSPYGSWTEVDVSAGKLLSTYSTSVSLSQKELYRIDFSVEYTGEARLIGTDGADIYGYLSSDGAADPGTGIPISDLARDTDGGDIAITYVLHPRMTYYFWVRFSNSEQSGTISIEIIPAEEPVQSDAGIWIYSGGQWRKATPYIYSGGQWRKATPYIYSGGDWIEGT